MSLKILHTQLHQKVMAIPLLSCTALVSAIHDCDKTSTLHFFLNQAVTLKDKTQTVGFPDLGEYGLSCYKTIILGRHPYENVTWLKSAGMTDDLVMCLLSYFANLCKIRATPPNDYHTLLEVAPVPATTEHITACHPELVEQVKQLYLKFAEQWDRLTNDTELQEVMPTGVCLLNLFDFGPSKAAHDILQVLRKYCKRSFNIVYYDSAVHKQTADPYQLIGSKLLEQLQNVHRKSVVFLAATGDTPIDDQSAKKLTEPLKTEIKNENIHHVCMSQEGMTQAKRTIEVIGIQAPFHDSKRIGYLLLLQTIKEKANDSFWIKRSEVESLSYRYDFESDGNELNDFLLFSTKVGSILYVDDIPSLREYVITDIVEFVKQIHVTRNSQQQLKNEASKVVEMFLTKLGTTK